MQGTAQHRDSEIALQRPSPLDLRRRVSAATWLAALLIGVIGAMSLWSSVGAFRAADARKAAYDVRNAVQHLLLDIQRVRSASRSYFLTADAVYLATLRDGTLALDSSVAQLRDIAGSAEVESATGQNLAHLVADYASSIRHIIDVAERHGRDSAYRLHESTSGNIARDPQSQVQGVISEQNQRIASNDREARLQARLAQAALLVGTLLAVIAVLVARRRLIQDMAARDAAEAREHALADELRDLYEHAPCGYHSLDDQGTFVRINATELALLGYSRDEIVGRMKFRELLTSEGERLFEEKFPRLKTEGAVRHLEFELKRKDGSLVPVALSATVVRDADGNFLMSRSTVVDDSERRRARDAVETLNRELQHNVSELEALNRELEMFSYSVSHDLRAPLRAIDGFSRILTEEYGPRLDTEAQRLLQVVRSNTHRMGVLIDDLLAFSRVSRRDLQADAVDMNSVVRDAIEDLRRDSGLEDLNQRITIRPLPPARGDAALLRHVWANLISNAVKYSRHRAEPRVIIEAEVQNGDAPIYRVRDNGVGFDMAHAGKLFTVFQRLHREDEFEGTGVGLAIVQRIIHRHGGRVWAHAVPNAGATFSFILGTEG